MKLNFFVILALFLISNFSFAQESSIDSAAIVLSLEDAKNIAIENHPKIHSSDNNVKAARERITISRSAYMPQITGNAVRAYADNNTRLAATNGLNNPLIIDRGSVGIGISQLITDFGRTSDLIDASKFEFKAEKANANLTRTSILLDVTRAYYNLLYAEALQKVAEDSFKARQKIFEQISLLRDVKMKSDLDVSIAKQVLSEGSLLKLKAQSVLGEAMATLSDTLGYGETKKFKLSSNIKITPPPSDLNSLVQSALKTNPELAVLINKKAASKKLTDANRKSKYPTISVLGYAGNTPIRNYSQNIDPNYAAAGVNISIPFFTGGRITAQEKESEYNTKTAGENLTAKKNQLMRDMKISFDAVQNTFKNIDLASQISKNANKTYDLTKARYEIGKSSIVDLSQAQLVKTQAEISSVNAIYEYLIQRSILEYRVGAKILSVSDISGDNYKSDGAPIAEIGRNPKEIFP